MCVCMCACVMRVCSSCKCVCVCVCMCVGGVCMCSYTHSAKVTYNSLVSQRLKKPFCSGFPRSVNRNDSVVPCLSVLSSDIE